MIPLNLIQLTLAEGKVISNTLHSHLLCYCVWIIIPFSIIMQIKKLFLISSLFSYVTFGQTTEILEPKIDVYEIPDFIVSSTLINSPLSEASESVTLFQRIRL